MGTARQYNPSGGFYNHEYHQEGDTIYYDGLKGKIVVKNEENKNGLPPYSNTPNTTYYAYSKERKRIEKIYYFRDHKLYKCVEFDIDKNRPHVHYWRNGVEVGRDRHDSKNIFPLNERDIRLYKQAMRWNQERKGKS